MKVEVTNDKKISVGSAKAGDVVCISDTYYLVLTASSSHFVAESDAGKRTLLAKLDSGEIIAPINSVMVNVVKTAKVTLTR